jgi:hypothetical protein
MQQKLWGSKSRQAIEVGEHKPALPRLQLEQLRGYRGQALLKLDCEFEMGDWDGKRLTIENRYGRWRWNFQASRQFEAILRRMRIRQARVLLELYAVDRKDGKLLPFNQAMGVIKKSTLEDENRIKMMVFSWCEINNKEVKGFADQWKLLKKLPNYGSDSLVHRPKSWRIKNYGDLKRAMKWVVANEMEGLVLRGKHLDAKVKDESEVDVVVIGRRMGRTVRGRSYLVALMPEKDTFVEVGHFGTGLTWIQERYLNGRLAPLKIREDGLHVWYEPKVILKLVYRGILSPAEGEAANNRVYRYSRKDGYEEIGLMNLGHLRMPGLDSKNPFRTDKGVTPKDLRLNQLKEYNRRLGEIRVSPSPSRGQRSNRNNQGWSTEPGDDHEPRQGRLPF